MSKETSGGRKPRVAIVFGGRSSEHAISCVTAGSVLAAIDRDRYEVVPIGISTEGRWVLAADEPERFMIAGGRLPHVDSSGEASVVLASDPTSRELVVHEPGAVPKAIGEVDVVFPLLHGPWGEDGTVQGLLELAGVPYVGAGVLSSAVSMDKEYMKRVFASVGIPVGPHIVVRPRAWDLDPDAVRESAAGLGFPLFVKPARGGSSIGTTRVTSPEELDAAIETARGHDPKVLVEATVEGREIECGVLASLDGPPEASVPAEINVSGTRDFYDFEAKYLGASDLEIPAPVDDQTTREIRRLAVEAFEAVSCEGFARVDFFLRPDGSLLVNEINTIPGFTPASAFPRMWEASGLDYPALVDRLLQLALHRSTGLR